VPLRRHLQPDTGGGSRAPFRRRLHPRHWSRPYPTTRG
jgi:hypothetical protein